MHKIAVFVSLIAAAGLAAGAPAALQAAGGHQQNDGQDGDHGHEIEVGEPADITEPDRTVEVTATDEMEFEPRQVEITAGDVVRFTIVNTGTLPHSFTIGSNEWHEHHEEEMQGMAVDKIVGHMRDEPNGMVVPPGESRELTWRFEGDGPVQFACHVPGHYPAGMKGRIRIGS